tara:strand:+ start:275 stop:520 length:246 start_codon:yes stop_codon:yes gene_type:complete
MWRTNQQDNRIAQFARCFIAEIEAPVIYANKDLRVGANIVIAFINGRERTSVGEADIALKAAKKRAAGVMHFSNSLCARRP